MPMAVAEHVVGHRATVTAVRFFPTPLLLPPPPHSPKCDKATLGGQKRRRDDAGAEAAVVPLSELRLGTALAVASVDRCLTVWSSAARDAPCLELRGAFGGPVTDLAWGAAVLPRVDQRGDSAAARASGCVGAAPFLLACSIDGSVAVVLFEQPRPSEPAAACAALGEAAGALPMPLSAPDSVGPVRAPEASSLGVLPPADAAFAGAYARVVACARAV